MSKGPHIMWEDLLPAFEEACLEYGSGRDLPRIAQALGVNAAALKRVLYESSENRLALRYRLAYERGRARWHTDRARELERELGF